MQIEKLCQIYQAKFDQKKPTLATAAPGRVNLLGEHTDYNDGFVLPMAIEARITILGAENGTEMVNSYAVDFEAADSFSLNEITFSHEQPWSNYIRGVCALLLEAGYSLRGMNLVFQGDVPVGAGLSSSAALEIATAIFINSLHELAVPPVELVKLAQRAENEFVGVNCGIMDQFISLLGEKGHALFLDCRSLDYQLIPVTFAQLGYSVVVIDSGVQRGLVDSEYNIRRSQCEEAVNLLKAELPQISALRDVGLEHLDLVSALPPVLAKRARHVITENQRVKDGVQCLQQGELDKFGKLLNASHKSLRLDYEVSCKELDLLVELARSVKGTLGARMTGAGFGGSIIALTRRGSVPELRELISQEYLRQTGITPHIFSFQAAQGAEVLKL